MENEESEAIPPRMAGFREPRTEQLHCMEVTRIKRAAQLQLDLTTLMYDIPSPAACRHGFLP
jgi:hypothetical protein